MNHAFLSHKCLKCDVDNYGGFHGVRFPQVLAELQCRFYTVTSAPLCGEIHAQHNLLVSFKGLLINVDSVLEKMLLIG